MGRTQMQDAVPMTLGQEFSTYGVMLFEDEQRLKEAALLIHEINLGATAIGTGINADPRYASIIAGIPDHQIEDVTLSNIRIFYRGGGRKEQAEVQPPERETNYPEPSMFGELPAYGFFVRHARGIDFNNVTVSYLSEEMRPPFLLADVTNAKFNSVTAYRALIVPMFVLRNVSDFTTNACGGVPNMHIDRVAQQNF